MIDVNGDLREARPLGEPSYTAPSVSADYVHVAATEKLHSFSLTMTDAASDGGLKGRLSSIAIGADGTVDAVNRNGEPWAYPGR